MDVKINDIKMNEVDIIIGEIQSVLTAMRMNTRWSSKNRLVIIKFYFISKDTILFYAYYFNSRDKSIIDYSPLRYFLKFI